MDNKIYYGEYSLAYWLDLLLHGKIELPEYQRYYVWKREDLNALVDTLRDTRFVPPVTIGSFLENNIKKNLIIDGQQRLTSVLLAAIGCFPKFSEWKDPAPASTDEDDSVDDDENAAYVIKWTYKKLLECGDGSIESIRSNLDDARYERLGWQLDPEFLKNKYIGFSYLVPEGDDAKDQRAFYARIFRDMNGHGKPLNILDSRRSLYFLTPGMEKFFDPEFVAPISIIDPNTKKVKQRLDFVRYLSIIDEFHKNGKNVSLVVKRFNKDKEQYFTDYIMDTESGDDKSRFRPIAKSFKDADCFERITKIKETFSSLGLPFQYPSIIDADIVFFGLVSTVLYEGKSFDLEQKSDFDAALKQVIEQDKKDQSKSPSKLSRLRDRITHSVELYNRFVR